MSRLLKTIDLPLFAVVQPRVLSKVAQILSAQNLAFRRALVVTGPGKTMAYGRRIAAALEGGDVEVRVEAIGAPTYAEVDRIKNDLLEQYFPDVVLAVGGGSAIDVVKLAATERRLPWVSVPTSASNDGFCSPVVVLWTDDKRKRVGGSMPIGVVSDLSVIASSPRRLRLAGVGDLISNITACNDWELAARRGKASLNGIARMLALSGARQMLGVSDPNIDDPGFLNIVVEGLILSGLAMEVCGTSRPCSGSEHLISHALDAGNVGNALHGEQVGVATLFCSRMQGRDDSALRRFAHRVGISVTPKQLGLGRQQFIEAARAAPGMRPGRWTVLSTRQSRRALEETFDRCFGECGG
jgi:glycerol-1-phosphate dehydrogenase [NAD(P)+]